MALQETKIRFTAAELAALDAAAAAAGLSRSALVRDRAVSPKMVLSTDAYHRLVSDACTLMRGNLNRAHIETLTAFVISRLAASYDAAAPTALNHR